MVVSGGQIAGLEDQPGAGVAGELGLKEVYLLAHSWFASRRRSCQKEDHEYGDDASPLHDHSPNSPGDEV